MEILSGLWLMDYDNPEYYLTKHPVQGEETKVYIDPEWRKIKGDNFLVFWYPPYMPITGSGWDYTWEIRNTFVVHCRLARIGMYPFEEDMINKFKEKMIYSSRTVEFKAEVLSVYNFVDYCQNLNESKVAVIDRYIYPKKFSIIHDRDYYGNFTKSIINDRVIYLLGFAQETLTGVLIKIDDKDKYHIIYHEHSDPGGDIAQIVNYPLNNIEADIIKDLINIADVMPESSK